MLALVGQPDLTDGRRRARIQEVLVDTGALAELEAEHRRPHPAGAGQPLDAADITDDARKALTELAHYVAWREL